MAISDRQRRNSLIDESKLVNKFDRLVDAGVVQYSSTQHVVRFEDQGFPVCFSVLPLLNSIIGPL